ncbi:MAG: uroporphyrinogen decarboxylase family protein [Candidatus Ratteibacteria bacterium]
MNPKTRVMNAVDRKNIDRIPLDIWATNETIGSLCDYLSISYEKLLERLGIDIRYIDLEIKDENFTKMPDGSFQRQLDAHRFIDIWGVIRKRINYGKGEYFELDESPLAGINDVKDVETFQLPSPDIFEITTEKLELYDKFAIVFTGDRLTTRTSFFKLAMYLRGFENFLLDLHINKKIARAIIDKIFEFHYTLNESIFKKYSDKIDIFLLGDDFGTQTGPVIGLESFREFFKQPLRAIVELCHKYNIRAMLHSCGSVKIFIPDLIQIGLDILNPVQHTASGMNLKELKREFGKDICFHGAIDVQKILPFGTRKDIENEVKNCIEILGENGGYICGPSHNLQSDIPVENIIYMYQCARSMK